MSRNPLKFLIPIIKAKFDNIRIIEVLDNYIDFYTSYSLYRVGWISLIYNDTINFVRHDKQLIFHYNLHDFNPDDLLEEIDKMMKEFDERNFT